MHTHLDRHVQRRVLVEVLVLNGVFFAVELVGGIASGSLALIADAGHMLADAGALGLALVAAWFASQPPTPHKSYGFYRAEILAALVNGLALVAIAGYVFLEAVRRFGSPRPVRGGLLLVVATVGLGVNVYSAWRLRHDGHDINMRGARLHMGADALGSVGAIVAGVLVFAFGQRTADPVIGAAIAALIGVSAWGLIREAVNILLEATPAHISLLDVRTAMEGHPGVVSVHDLHVWTLTSGYIALSAHVVARDPYGAQALLVPLRELVYHDFGIQHATLQVETPDLADEPVHCVDDPRCLP
jgi:cobalt-zinc-cadmium efflux system protein